MDDGRGRASRAEWEKRVQRWQDSGLTAEEFASEFGINPRTLSYWKWRLKRDAKDDAGSQAVPAEQHGRLRRKRRKRAETDTTTSTGSFLEIAATAGDARFELELGKGRRLRIPSAFEAETLKRLLGVLEEMS